MPSSKGLFYSDVKSDIVLINTVVKNKNKYTVKQYSDACAARSIQDTSLINQATHHVDPGDIHHVLSPPPTAKKDKRRTKHNDLRVVTLHETVYNVSASRHFIQQSSSLIDQGANGGIAGDNVRIIATTDRQVNVSGIDNHQLTDLKNVTYSPSVCILAIRLSIRHSKWNSLET